MHVHCTLPVHAHTPYRASSFRFCTSCFFRFFSLHGLRINQHCVSKSIRNTCVTCTPEPKQLSVLKAKCLQRLERRSQRLGLCFEKCLKALFFEWTNCLGGRIWRFARVLCHWNLCFPSVSWQTQWDGLMSGLVFSSYEINPDTAMFLIIAQNRPFTTLILECGMCSGTPHLCRNVIFLCLCSQEFNSEK